MLVLPQVVLLPAAAALARRVGWRRAAACLGSRQLLRETDVAHEIAWLVQTELLRLPYRQDRRESARDALAEEVFGDHSAYCVSALLLGGQDRGRVRAALVLVSSTHSIVRDGIRILSTGWHRHCLDRVNVNPGER